MKLRQLLHADSLQNQEIYVESSETNHGVNMKRINEVATAAWIKNGAKVVEWEKICTEYKTRKAAGTLGTMPIESVAEAVLSMCNTHAMAAKDVSALFDEKPNWFSWLMHWYGLETNAKGLFSFVSDPYRLRIFEASTVAMVPPEKQAQGARNLIANKLKPKVPKVSRSGSSSSLTHGSR